VNLNSIYLKYARARATLYSVALLSLFAQGCARAPEHEPTVRIDADAAPYVARFEQEASLRGQALSVTDLIVEFGQVQGTDRGECQLASGETPVVVLSQAAWDRSSDSEREELVFHELGHCLLGLRHEAGLTSDGIPASVMNPTEIDGAIYKQNREYYLSGLFKE
jgi:hypothetical protein